MTNGEAVSLIVNSFRLTNRDQHISRRFVLRTLRSTVKTWIAQRMADRSIQQDYNLYSELKCFEFERINSVKCPNIEFRRCDVLMKSVEKLPELVHSKIGASIKEVISVDGNFEFRLIDAQQYRRNKNRTVKIDNQVYLYVGSDGYLYIPDHEIYTVDLLLLTQETELLEECSKCGEKCKSGWDAQFICPDKLMDPLFKDVKQIIGATYKAVPVDQNPNGIEGA